MSFLNLFLNIVFCVFITWIIYRVFVVYKEEGKKR